MKKLKIAYSLLLLSAVAGFTSCDKNDDPKEPTVNETLNGAFVLNQGSYQMNNAGLAYFSTDNSDAPLVADLFFDVNKYKLGDNATDIAKYKGDIYISVTGSNCIYKLNNEGKVTGRLLFHTDEELQGGVRYMTFKDDCLYASFYGGVVAKISTDKLEILSKLKTGGANLEGIAEANGYIYVADSYQSTYDATTGQSDIVYSDKLYVIDSKSFTVTGTVQVSVNPNKLLAHNGKLFLISWGNYADKGYSFQMIEPAQANKVTELGVATDMGIGNGKIYLVNSETDWTTWSTTNTWFSYDINAGTMNNASFMTNAPEDLNSDHISMISVDDLTGEVYVGTTQYTLGNGKLYRFSKNGEYKTNFDCGGQNPIGAVFL
ncbi:MAG: hypothetical protein K2J87_02625 [Muribaculaceae bacterium]|nr:hypothetical protein [Muribaculaceae bacterium]